jgi:transposase
MLFPNSIDDYVPQNHLARVANNIMEQLDTRKIEDKYSTLE